MLGRAPYRTSYAVYRDLCGQVDRGEIKPVKMYYLGDKLDPRLTTVRTINVAKLTEKRRNSCFDFSPWMPAPTSEPPPKTEHARPKRDQARAAHHKPSSRTVRLRRKTSR